MATTIHEPPQIVKAPPGNGGWRNLVPSEGSPRAVQYAPPPSSTAIWVVLFSITMTFAAFTSALIVRQGSSLDWRHFTLPSILYGNTAVLLASSATLEMARRRVASFMGGARSQVGSPARWLYVTLGLGLLFVAGQYAAWLQLKGEGFYLATNPSSSFFYVLTAAHALHVMGGLGGMVNVLRKLGQSRLRRSTLDATSHYWHFMGGLWVYLLLLLWMKL
ncbi:MAG: cytochrome c oxidase subunit 3 [Acidobacteriia bacterium]|nr:cytochrome c oxidase subunit 3 [Terriglobia bacterium]